MDYNLTDPRSRPAMEYDRHFAKWQAAQERPAALRCPDCGHMYPTIEPYNCLDWTETIVTEEGSRKVIAAGWTYYWRCEACGVITSAPEAVGEEELCEACGSLLVNGVCPACAEQYSRCQECPAITGNSCGYCEH